MGYEGIDRRVMENRRELDGVCMHHMEGEHRFQRLEE